MMAVSSTAAVAHGGANVLDYRPEIDGLRAIAVLAVILYHVEASWLPGGYLGVDVFFVISGYLITSLLARDLGAGRFSLAGFYERRARRILPALFVVLIATLPLAAFWLLPTRQADFAGSLLAVLGFSSNVLFWLRTGYFMPDAETEPLLHTWSLAIEEQFYVLFPLLLWLLWRAGPRWRLAALALIAAASLGTSAVLAGYAPSANFYLLPSRAWELLAGALVALAAPAVGRGRGVLAAIGLAMVLGGLAVLGEAYPMPSPWALIPVGGTALLLACAPGTAVARLLGAPVPRAIGLVSYSAYLWHWPILVFARLRWGEGLGPWVLAGLVALTFAAAGLTFALVERPFRRRGAAAWMPVRPFAGLMVAGAAGIAAAGWGIGLMPAGPVASRLSPEQIEAMIATNYGLSEVCEGAFTLDPACRTSDAPEVMVWGDSFAMHLVPGLRVGALGGLVQMTKSVCIPAAGISVVTPEYPASWAEGCLAFNDKVLAWLAEQPSIRTVVVSSPFGLIFGEVYRRGGEVAQAPRPDLVADALIDTATRVRGMGKEFVIVSPPPVTGEDLGQCLARNALADGPPDACDFTLDQVHDLSRRVRDFLQDLSGMVPVVFLDTLICPDGICDTRIGDVFMYRDAGHLSIEAATLLGERDGLYAIVRRAAASTED